MTVMVHSKLDVFQVFKLKTHLADFSILFSKQNCETQVIP